MPPGKVLFAANSAKSLGIASELGWPGQELSVAVGPEAEPE